MVGGVKARQSGTAAARREAMDFMVVKKRDVKKMGETLGDTLHITLPRHNATSS